MLQTMKLQNAERGVDPAAMPVFHRMPEAKLQQKLEIYKEVIDIIGHFVDKYLTTVNENALLIAITDNQGHLLAYKGNAAMIAMNRMLGIVEGIRYDEFNGPSSVHLCLTLGRPVQLMGKDHYHEALHPMACYSVPFQTAEAEGTISMMTAIEGAHPHLLGLLGTVADYAERETLLRSQNMQLQILNQALLNTPHYGVLLTDKEGRILELNAPMLDMLEKISPNSGFGAGSSVFGMPRLGKAFRDVIEQGGELIGVQLPVDTDGTVCHLMLDIVPIVDSATGVPIRFVSTVRDISELQQTKERLYKAEKLAFAGQLAASVAHEIRNPLTTVKGLLQLSNNKHIDVPHYDLIISELERMNLIISELLLLGKPQAVEFTAERCSGILQEVLEVFDAQASMNGIVLSTSIADEEPISCDRNQVKQIFFNLLHNAIEALPYGGNIDIDFDVRDGYQLIRFADNGVGMAPEVLKHLGEPFLTTRPDGTGLGLMVVQNIVAGHRGRLEITSNPGKGTRLDVYLPLMPAP